MSVETRNVTLIAGGVSPEHSISIRSAKNILAGLLRVGFSVQVIYITEAGAWRRMQAVDTLLETDDWLGSAADRVHPVMGQSDAHWQSDADPECTWSTDVVFPITHGRQGEDGCLQGLLELMQLPYVGAAVESSAVCMDKIATKVLLQAADIPVAPFTVWRHNDELWLDELIQTLGLPLFVKPCRTGSSIGITKVTRDVDIMKAVRMARKYDDVVLFEKAIVGRELEVPVLGNADPVAAVPGEIIPAHDFYDYDAKYIDPDGAKLQVPADLPADVVVQLQDLAVRAYRTLECRGMARVDFLMQDDGTMYLNELNTLPGFTSISLYPQCWAQSGKSLEALLTALVQFALEGRSAA